MRSEQGGRVHFGSLIHRLALDGSTLDPGDPNAYRCSWGGVITADGAEAEIATPPVLTRPGFAGQIRSWAEAGEAELRRAVPAGLELTGYSAHFSAAMPARLNEPVCRLYAETFAAGLMLLMERADSPGLLIRPRPGRTELCGEFLAGESLPAVAAFAAGSTRACAAAVSRRSAGGLLPPGLEVRLAPAVRRYGWYVDRAAFGTDLHAASRRTLLPLASGGTISAQSHLELAWAAARQALADAAADTDVRTTDAMVTGSLPLPGEDRAPISPARHEPGDGVRPGPGNRTDGETPLILGPRHRPDFALCPVVATWDFTVFAANSPERTAYVCVPRDSLPGFLDRLKDGALDDAITGYLAQPARRQILSAHRQTRHLAAYDQMGAPAKLLAPERDPQTGRHESERRSVKYAFTRPGKPRHRNDPPDQPRPAHDDSSGRARPRFTRRALLAAAVLAVLVVGAAAAAIALGRASGAPPVPTALSFQPSALSFPNVAVDSSATENLVMTNTSRFPLTISRTLIGGPDENDYSVVAEAQDFSAGHVGQAIWADASHPPACPHPLQPARTCAIAVKFAPLEAGERIADLRIYLASYPLPQDIALTGTGVGVAANAGLTLAPATLPAAVAGKPDTVQITAAGGTAPYRFSVSSGALPPGLSLNPVTGVLSGTPTTAGSYQFIIAATDSSPTHRAGATVYILQITSAALTPAALTLAPATLPAAITAMATFSNQPRLCNAEFYKEQITASGGTPPYTFSIGSGVLPPGLSLNPDTGAISGTAEPGFSKTHYPFTVSVTDSSVPPITASHSYTINDDSCTPLILAQEILPPAITTSSIIPLTCLAKPYTGQMTASGGTSPYTFSITKGGLPPGLSLNPDTGVISGTPVPEPASGSYSFIVTVTDSSLPSITVSH
ncbi:MAG: putative Ig domain-containing protein, partial [Streptosporangiaceae bacterium]